MSCLKCLKKLIKDCDCFGTFVTFRINKENELKSLFGGFSTIIYSMIKAMKTRKLIMIAKLN